MKFFENNFHYDYSFPAVSLAFFLRYPNPYSRHVLTSDVIDRYVDSTTGRLHTTRLHLKKSKVPSAMLKLLPKGIGGAENSGQSYILERSVVDVREGWMKTESRNMEWTGVLSVVEKQDFMRQPLEDGVAPHPTALDGDGRERERTAVKTTVTFKSRLGQGMLNRQKKPDANSNSNATAPAAAVDAAADDEPKRGGFLASWSTAGIQRTIELIGVRRTRDAVLKSKEGMNVVLERLRHGGVVAVLEGMRQDRELMGAGHKGPWKRVWMHGKQEHHDDDD